MANLAPYVFWQNFDNNGNPLAGGKVYTYEAGTSTPKATYTDSGGLTANANPVILDSAGRAAIWLGDGGYKFILKTAADVTIDTEDNIGGTASTAFGAVVYDISANTLVVDTYANALLVCTGTITLTLPAVSGINEGFYFIVRNDGSGVVTVDPDGSETINNVASLALNVGESAVIICDGDEWSSLFNIPAFVATLTGTQTLTNKTIIVKDSEFTIQDNSDVTKQAVFQLSGLSTATTATLDVVASGTIQTKVPSVVVQTFTASGTYTPTTGMEYCTIEVVGGGGGSGGLGASATGSRTGGGGGGGYARKTVAAATIGASKAVTIGAGGTAGANTGGTGGTGGTTSVGAIVTATGGVGSTGTNSASVTLVGALGGVGASGDLNSNGNAGGSASPSGFGGSGGGSYFGGGGIGGNTGTGTAGTNYGGGGGGDGPGQRVGWAGAAGVVIITEYVRV